MKFCFDSWAVRYVQWGNELWYNCVTGPRYQYQRIEGIVLPPPGPGTGSGLGGAGGLPTGEVGTLPREYC